ncbi:MAG: BrnT family toxin [Gemmatimonadaceae bacterium]|nr:BrnT family toxin [Gemmatimonadaceae bacterium]
MIGLLRSLLLVAHDVRHSQTKERFHGLGLTAADRGLFVVFTPRGQRIRVISARDMTRRERGHYERAQEADNQ